MSNNALVNRVPLLLILFVLIAMVVYLQWPKVELQEKAFQRIISVQTTVATLSEFTDSIEAIGTSRANEQVFITSKHADLVDEISFTDGQLVNKGDVLVKLNNQEELAKVSELNANLSESVAQFKRFQELLSNKATSKSLVDQQEAKTKAIAAQLQSARTKLDDLTIKAPFAGVLGFREISVGAYINAGSVITSLDDLSVIKVDFALPERFLTTIKLGQTITAFNTAYKNQAFTGSITSIDSRINPTTRTLKVRAIIINKGLKLRPGMLLNVQLIRQKELLLQLPESTIIPIENNHFVFSVVDGTDAKKVAQRKNIIIGRRQAGYVEVLSGIEPGEQIVTQGTLKLRDGAIVKVLEHIDNLAGQTGEDK